MWEIASSPEGFQLHHRNFARVSKLDVWIARQRVRTLLAQQASCDPPSVKSQRLARFGGYFLPPRIRRVDLPPAPCCHPGNRRQVHERVSHSRPTRQHALASDLHPREWNRLDSDGQRRVHRRDYRSGLQRSVVKSSLTQRLLHHPRCWVVGFHRNFIKLAVDICNQAVRFSPADAANSAGEGLEGPEPVGSFSIPLDDWVVGWHR
jgi:hypothetical protein